MLLGSHNEDGMTLLSGVELYPNVCTHSMRIRTLCSHPYAFGHHSGFIIVAVVPDANGWEKLDMLMAKRVRDHSSMCVAAAMHDAEQGA